MAPLTHLPLNALQNFTDPKTGLAMMTRMGFRPNENYCDGLHVVYLGGQRLAFTHSAGRLQDGFPGDVGVAHPEGGLSVGGLTIEMIEPFKKWVVTYEGECEDTPDGGVLLMRKKERPDGWMTPNKLSMRVVFEATADEFYTADDEKHGHFEQVGNVTGIVSCGGDTWQIDGRGVRDKSWGARQWSGSGSVVPKEKTAEQIAAEEEAARNPTPHVHWFSVTFGEQAALNASCGKGPDGTMRGQGWLQIGKKTRAFGPLRCIKRTISLPRQARDKHRESTQERTQPLEQAVGPSG
jgi:hypothetical protein